jgi:hypothetical protein
MKKERLKISGCAVCTAHSWHQENASEKVFPAVILTPVAGKIPNRRIIPRFIALEQMIIPDSGDLYAMCFQTNRFFDEIGNVVDWINGNRVATYELQQVKAMLGEPAIFEIEGKESLEVQESITSEGCIGQCDYPNCSPQGCVRVEKMKFMAQYEFFKRRARLKHHVADSGEVSPEEYNEWAKKNLKSGYE